jgi:hypothetical protein
MFNTHVLFKVLAVLVVTGVVAALFETFVPISEKFKRAIYLVGGLGVFLYILDCFHLL